VLGRTLRSLALLACLTVPGGCRKTTPAPYEEGAAPTPAALLGLAAPQTAAMIVPDAKVVLNRVARGNLAFLAQQPQRFRGSVQVSGNELVTLAVHENGYALRYKLDAMPTGFYHGPQAQCAIRSVLGIDMAQEDLVASVLGGAPVIAGDHQIVSQGWDAGAGVEKLVIANATHVEELRFDLVKGSWRFVGARLWTRKADGGKGQKLWELDHEGMHAVGKATLPEKTTIRSPGKRKDNLVVITYRDRDLDPPFAKSSDDAGGDAGDDAGRDDGAWEGGGAEGWEGDEDEEGWEGDETPPAKPDVAAKPDDAATPDVAAKPDAAKPAKPALPGVFVIDGAGLPDRGDLCR
jgi:hypothetical protein